MKKFEIKNREEKVKELMQIIKDTEISMLPYDVDIYGYIDDDGNLEFYKFTNVGGNSWLDDDHILVYTIRQCTNDIFDFFADFEDAINCIDKSKDELMNEAMKYYNYDDINYYDYYYGIANDCINVIEDDLQILKKIVIAKAFNNEIGLSEITNEDIEKYEEIGYLTENETRNRHTVIWYSDSEERQACYDVTISEFLTDEEIEKELL